MLVTLRTRRIVQLLHGKIPLRYGFLDEWRHKCEQVLTFATGEKRRARAGINSLNRVALATAVERHLAAT